MTGDLKNFLEETLMDNEPPMQTNTDDILHAGRRKQGKRRMGIAGIAAAAVAVAGVVVGMTVGLPHLTADADEPAPPADQDQPDETYIPVDSWDEYSKVLEDLYMEQGPDSQYKAEEGGEPFALTESGDASSTDPDFTTEIPTEASMMLKTADGKPVGSTSVALYEPGDWSKEPGDARLEPFGPTFPGDPIISCWSGETEVQQGNDENNVKTEITDTDCEDTTTPDGDRMIRMSSAVGYQGEEPESYTNGVVIYRADDTAVKVQSFCGHEDEDDEYGGTCHDIQFDLDQLAAIAIGLPQVIVTDDGH